MHARAIDAKDGLGHEGGVQPVGAGDGLDHQFKGHDAVGSGQGVAKAEVNLMLGLGHLVMGGLDLKAHLFQRQAHVAPGILAAIQGRHVKVAGLVMGEGGGLAVLVQVEKEEFALRTQVKGITHRSSLGQHPLE